MTYRIRFIVKTSDKGIQEVLIHAKDAQEAIANFLSRMYSVDVIIVDTQKTSQK